MKKYLVIAPFLLLLLIGCSSGQSDYRKSFNEWKLEQDKSNQEYREKYQAITANLTTQLTRSQKLAGELQAEVKNIRAERDSLASQIETMHTREELQTVKEKLGAALAAAAIAEKKVELDKNDYFALGHDYLTMKERYFDLVARIDAVNDLSDPTTTSNLTENKRDNFMELWSLWYKTLSEVN